MKRYVTAPLKAFLLSGPPHPQPIVADCFTLTLVTGDVFRLTSFDWGVTIAADGAINQPGGFFTSTGSRVRRGRIVNKRGLETSTLDITIGSNVIPDYSGGALATPPVQTFGMSLGQAAIAGLLYGATVRVETVYGDGATGNGLTRLPDGTYNDGGWGSVIKFIGLVADIAVHKQEMVISCSSFAHYLEPPWPPLLIQYGCPWTLFGPGCANLIIGTGSITAGSSTITSWTGATLDAGSIGRPITIGTGLSTLISTIVGLPTSTTITIADIATVAVTTGPVTIGLLAANFAVPGTVAATPASTVMQVYNSLTNPSGWFSHGRILFLTGQNAGLTRTIQVSLGAGAAGDFVTTVMNDTPYAFYRFNDPTGSPIIADSSGNGHSATIVGGVTLQQPTMVPGDPTGFGALFDGTTGYLAAPVPIPPNYRVGVTFEFWYKLTSGAAADQPTGIFDTNGLGTRENGFRNNGQIVDTRPGFEWNRDRPFIGINHPATGTVFHIVVCIYGSDSMDVYINGTLWQTSTIFGSALLVWNSPIFIGRTTFPPTSGSYFFDGTLQDMAIYRYAFSADQALTHYLAGASAPSPVGAGVFTLLTPLIYAPAPGDSFVAYPGCDKKLRTCTDKFNNRINYGGEPFTPVPESVA
jgi:hypothetical protein